MTTLWPEQTEIVPLPAVAGDRPEPTWRYGVVLAHRPVSSRYRYLRLHLPEIARPARPGQFVMITVARPGEVGPVLPRPMAIYSSSAEGTELAVVYGIVGQGTRTLASFEEQARLLTVGPLGQGFRVEPGTRRTLLIGRGIGTCSLTMLAQHNAARGIETVAVVSGSDEAALIGGELYRRQPGTRVVEVTDAAGTSDVRSLWDRLTAELDTDPPEQIFTCGSRRLARLSAGLGRRWRAGVQVSLEANMACGIGYCHGCATGSGATGRESPLICVDGPVFSLGER
jgi:dihydroorotate dehydrogenase electron transfer subunit